MQTRDTFAAAIRELQESGDHGYVITTEAGARLWVVDRPIEPALSATWERFEREVK